MTLTKIKPRRASTASKQRIGHHHRHSHQYLKTYWPYIPILLVIIAGFGINSWLNQLHKSVLGYATDMSIQSLLDDTNAERSDYGLPPLTINAQLDQAAQTKANNMAAQDYWSHDTPEGQTPWSFMIAAGYNYQTAGENLAYGFDTASDVMTAWMNSPDHRANILNPTYQNVGFGIVNIANYQNSGPETLVDAMYGSPESSAVVAATPQSTTTKPSNSNNPAPIPYSSSNVATTTPATPSQPKNLLKTKNQLSVGSQQEQISRIQLVASSQAYESLVALILFGVAAFIFLLLRHTIAWRKTLLKGERFVLSHPSLDILAVAIVIISLILTRTVGSIS